MKSFDQDLSNYPFPVPTRTILASLLDYRRLLPFILDFDILILEEALKATRIGLLIGPPWFRHTVKPTPGALREETSSARMLSICQYRSRIMHTFIRPSRLHSSASLSKASPVPVGFSSQACLFDVQYPASNPN